MQPVELQAIIRFSQVALRVLSERLLTWATMLITAAMFGWGIYKEAPMSLLGASAFALLVFWRVSRVDVKKEEPKGDSE